jgi:hypothetical protein
MPQASCPKPRSRSQGKMDALENVRLGMSAEKTVTVTSEMTVGHFVTPMMILHMEMASGAAIALRAL